jgi:2'-5' RNA ligase
MIRIRLSSYHLTVVPLGDINTINGKDVVSAINEAGDDHFKLVELLR